MEILWDMLVTYDKVTSTEVFETTLMKNRVSKTYSNQLGVLPLYP